MRTGSHLPLTSKNLHISNYKNSPIIYDRCTTGGTWTGSKLFYSLNYSHLYYFSDMNKLQRIITAAINDILGSRLNVVLSWGLHNKREITDGVIFNVQGFKYTGEVKIVFDYIRSHAKQGLIFRVQIADTIATDISAEQLVDYIDEQVEKVDNYEEAVKASMTPEEYAFAKSIENIIFI